MQVVAYCGMLQYVALCCGMLRFNAVCCCGSFHKRKKSGSLCVAVCCVADCCSVMQCTTAGRATDM